MTHPMANNAHGLPDRHDTGEGPSTRPSRPVSRWATLVRSAGAAAVLASGAAAAPAQAQTTDWPSRPITLVVPSTAGGAIDSYARTVAQSIGEQLKQTVIVDNKPGGGGGLIAATAVARARPDGYTLFVGTAAILTINPSAYRKLPYAADDFAYVCKGVEFPLVLVASPSLGVTDLAALGRWLKAHPDKASYASYQPGTPSHFLGYQLGERLGLPLTHIPYKGSAPQVTDLLGGSVPFGFTQLVTALPFIKSGKLVALATTGPNRVDVLPDTPTLAEQGLSELTTTAWFGLVAPRGTPADVLDRLTAAHRTAVESPDVRRAFATQALYPSNACGPAFRAQVDAETQRWARVVKATGFTASD